MLTRHVIQHYISSLIFLPLQFSLSFVHQQTFCVINRNNHNRKFSLTFHLGQNLIDLKEVKLENGLGEVLGLFDYDL